VRPLAEKGRTHLSLTAEQQVARNAILSWLEGGADWMFYLGGYAGTGKTFLLQDLINSLDKKPHCLAPTGKAASVLAKKLKDVQVRTIHSALYKPMLPDMTELEALEQELKMNPGADDLIEAIREVKRKMAEKPLRFTDNLVKEIVAGDYVFVDEASMVTERMVEDLQRTKAKVLFVGDPGQLPPVGDSGYFANQIPQAMLSEIQRQALDNPIIRLSMQVRKGEPISRQIESEQIVKRPKQGYPVADLANFDQVLTGANHTRRRINRGLRLHKGITGKTFPQQGEKLICLKNKFARGGWIVNGVQCLATSDCAVNAYGDLQMDVLYEEQMLQQLDIYHFPFEVHYNPQAEEDPWPSRTQLYEFDYGYAITVHKSQGSEWDNVVLVDDNLFCNDKVFRKRWLYTAVTRAKEKLTWLTE
jgi:exodeoxyribonuclease-5